MFPIIWFTSETGLSPIPFFVPGGPPLAPTIPGSAVAATAAGSAVAATAATVAAKSAAEPGEGLRIAGLLAGAAEAYIFAAAAAVAGAFVFSFKKDLNFKRLY